MPHAAAHLVNFGTCIATGPLVSVSIFLLLHVGRWFDWYYLAVFSVLGFIAGVVVSLPFGIMWLFDSAMDQSSALVYRNDANEMECNITNKIVRSATEWRYTMAEMLVLTTVFAMLLAILRTSTERTFIVAASLLGGGFSARLSSGRRMAWLSGTIIAFDTIVITDRLRRDFDTQFQVAVFDLIIYAAASITSGISVGWVFRRLTRSQANHEST